MSKYFVMDRETGFGYGDYTGNDEDEAFQAFLDDSGFELEFDELEFTLVTSRHEVVNDFNNGWTLREI